MKTCLVTGVNSFTGKYIKSEFENNGFRVIGTVFSTKAEIESNDIYVMNLLDYSNIQRIVAITKPDVVIHLAGVSSTTGCDLSLYYNTHIIGTLNLLSALVREKLLPKVILASSAHVYGCSQDTCEDSLLSPKNDYGVSKLAMEYMSRLWMDKLPIVIARPFNYTGVGQSIKFIIPKIVDAFKNQSSILPIGNIDIYRDFSDVRYIAKAYFTLVTEGKDGEVYNLSSSSVISIREIINYLKEISGVDISLKIMEEFIRRNDIKSIKGNNKKFYTLKGAPSVTPIIETIQWMLSYPDMKARD